MAEGKQHFRLYRVVVPIAGVNALPVLCLQQIIGKISIAGSIFRTEREGFRQMSGGIDLTGEKTEGRFSSLTAGQIHHQDGFYLIDPRHGHRRPGLKHYDDVGIHCGDFADQGVHCLGKRQIRPVESLRFIGVGETGNDDDLILFLGDFAGVFHQTGIRFFQILIQ